MEPIEQYINEFIAKTTSPIHAKSAVNLLGDPSFSVRTSTDAALDLVSEAAAAIRGAEERAIEMVARAEQMVARAEQLANAAIEKIQLAEGRIDRAEAAQRKAEADCAEARRATEQAQTRLAATEAEVAAAEQRASLAERRASDAEVAVDCIVNAIRTQLPVSYRSGVGDEQIMPRAMLAQPINGADRHGALHH
jgi:ATP/maltotriose-dependent transcriptional regulator MalT